MYDIVALGESLIDFTPAGINEMGMPLFSQNPGGAPANVLAMASKLGRSTAFVGKVGRDAFGRFLQEHMEKAGIDCSALSGPKHSTMTSPKLRVRVFTAKSAPQLRASSSRASEISVMSTWAAPRALQLWASRIPMGPEPKMATLAPASSGKRLAA